MDASRAAMGASNRFTRARMTSVSIVVFIRVCHHPLRATNADATRSTASRFPTATCSRRPKESRTYGDRNPLAPGRMPGAGGRDARPPLDRHARAVEFREAEAGEEVVGRQLHLLQEADGEVFAEAHAFDRVRAPVHAGDVAAD